ncbi:MAG: hypothetical protein WKF87_01540 [Chryseolinea sp.]
MLLKLVNTTVWIFAAMFCTSSCSQKKERLNPTSSDVFMKGKRLAELQPKKLGEVSGLAASFSNKGLLWTHNDSGNDAEVYLIDTETRIRQTYVLDGVDNRDWEDIAIGPGPDPSRHYLYVADIGDNLAIHSNKYIYRFEEPVFSEASEGAEKKITITAFDTIVFQLSDSKRDTEALLIDPKTKDLYVISKYSDPNYIYQIRYPYASGDIITANRVGSLNLRTITSAAISSTGNEILIKNYRHIYYWKNIDSLSVLDVLKQLPVEVPYEVEPQGEAIAWSADDSGFYTLSEKDKGKKSYLYFYQRK